jgi:hypothetical protein
MAKYNIINKTVAGCGNVGYVIEVNDQEYIADITVRTDKDYCTEFAVFKSVDQQITFANALPLYTKQNVEMTYESLEKCIDEFIEQL